MDWQPQLIVVATTAYAMALGGVIGFEREVKNRPAGFRTHMLVAGASGLLLGIGLLVLEDPSMPHSASIRADPLRLFEAVVAGVSFIGGGTIFAMRGHDTVTGITTAASLLMVAVIGAAAGLRYYWLAAAATALTLLVLTALNLIERHFGLGGRTPGGGGKAQ
jgi:putative Mg2+ transporter-C (MgtC) family protein